MPSPAKCFMYIFIIIAAVWASIASYYYFSEDYLRCYGAVVSGGIFGILSLTALIWNFYLEKRKSKVNILSEIVPKNYLLLKILYDQLKNYLKENNFRSSKLLGFASILVVIYLSSIAKKLITNKGDS